MEVLTRFFYDQLMDRNTQSLKLFLGGHSWVNGHSFSRYSAVLLKPFIDLSFSVTHWKLSYKLFTNHSCPFSIISYWLPGLQGWYKLGLNDQEKVTILVGQLILAFYFHRKNIKLISSTTMLHLWRYNAELCISKNLRYESRNMSYDSIYCDIVS